MTEAAPPSQDADRAAVYCRESLKDDSQAVTVNRQKRRALQDCAKLGLVVSDKHIYVDSGVSAWKRDRNRPGWDALVNAARRGEIKHIVCYRPDRLMRQPHDLEELLSISDEFGIRLYGRVNRRDLQDADDRYALRAEIAQTRRSSDDTSPRLKDRERERAENGVQLGARSYGYTPDGMSIVESEAAVVQEIFARFTTGETPYGLSMDLNRRGIATAKGKAWSEATVRQLLRNPRVAAVVWHQGRVVGMGQWPAIIDRPTWDFVRDLLSFRNLASQAQPAAPRRTYVLRGLVRCRSCGTTMVGCSGSVYRCSRSDRHDGQRCARAMLAEPLEELVADAAVKLLTDLSSNPGLSRTTDLERAERAIVQDERQLRELNDLWRNEEITTAAFKDMHRDIRARIRANERLTIATTRPMSAIADLIGPDAKAKWDALPDERRNSVLRYLFRAVFIGPYRRGAHPDSIDFDRVAIEPNDLI